MKTNIEITISEAQEIVCSALTEVNENPPFPFDPDNHVVVKIVGETLTPNYYLNTNPESARANKINLIKLVREAVREYNEKTGVNFRDEFGNITVPTMGLAEAKLFVEKIYNI